MISPTQSAICSGKGWIELIITDTSKRTSYHDGSVLSK